MLVQVQSILRSVRWIIVAAATVTGSFVSAQGFHPFAEPLEFNPDYQLFAPISMEDISELSSRQRANTGWYATYDRMRVGLNRADSEPESGRIDFGWGNRYDFGIMGEENSGWNFSLSKVGGPHAHDVVIVSRPNLIQNTDLFNPTSPLYPRSWRNHPQLRERVVILRDSLNVAESSSFEANKTWRLEPYRYGGILEPLIGLKFGSFTDYAQNDRYSVSTVLATTIEQINMDIVTTKNSMLLGQVGWRYGHFSNRWTLSNEFKVFGGQNFQTQHVANYQTVTTYANPAAVGTQPIAADVKDGTFFNGSNNSEFVLGMDVRAEAAYQITKAFNLRGGFQLNYIGRGIWRGSNEGLLSQNQQQDTIMPAFTFGLSFNR